VASQVCNEAVLKSRMQNKLIMSNKSGKHKIINHKIKKDEKKISVQKHMKIH